MKSWAERAYETDLDELPAMIHEIVEKYNFESIQKINLVVVSTVALLKNFYENRLFDMSEQEVDQSKWIILKSIFPNIGDGPVSIMKWNNLLSPTSDPYFHTIPAEIFADIQDSARLLIERHESGKQNFSDIEMDHWRSIVSGVAPFGYTIIKGDEGLTVEA